MGRKAVGGAMRGSTSRSGISMKITGVDLYMKEVQARLNEIIPECLQEYMDDTSEVSASYAPHKTGQLDSTYEVTVAKTKRGWRGRVAFKAMDGNYNYAIIMHEGFYNLGEGSRAKTGTGSKFGMVSQSVGRRYLAGPFEQLANEYVKDLAYRITEKLQ